jgi:hypothetical protein
MVSCLKQVRNVTYYYNNVRFIINKTMYIRHICVVGNFSIRLILPEKIRNFMIKIYLISVLFLLGALVFIRNNFTFLELCVMYKFCFV